MNFKPYFTETGKGSIMNVMQEKREGIKKPEELAHLLISILTKPGDWIYDPFAGKGSFYDVATKYRRNYLGTEWGQYAVIKLKERGVKIWTRASIARKILGG